MSTSLPQQRADHGRRIMTSNYDVIRIGGGRNGITRGIHCANGAAALKNDAGEAPRLFVPQSMLGRPVSPYPSAAKNDDRRPHPPGAQFLLHFLIFELEAHAAHRVAK
jgi:hypothetical protein